MQLIRMAADPIGRGLPFLGALLALGLTCAGLTPARAALSDAVRVVMRKNHHFEPSDLFLRRGDTIVLVNGDDSVVHHAFIEADRFTFDGGDQEPGTDRALKLTEAGDFIIRCGIHPKMRMTLHVH